MNQNPTVTKDLSEDTEFYVPDKGLSLQTYLDLPTGEGVNGKSVRMRKQAIHHLARYNWAARALASCEPGTILDVACGSGYGSSILAAALPDFQVIGGDYDARAVEYARKNFGGAPNLVYRTADIVTWVHPEDGKSLGKFDYIVSFDTIEHLLFRELALISIAEHVSPSGAVLLSTPAHRENLLNPGWEHHKIEYSYRHLYNFVRRFFESVSIPDNGSLPALDFWENEINAHSREYLLRCNPMFCTKPISIGLKWPPEGAE